MIVVIDTSSLLSLVRYYLPFDSEEKLIKLFQSKVETGEIVVLDKVFEECRYVAKGIVIDHLSFLSEIKNQTKTTEVFPTKTFFSMLDNQFVNLPVIRKLTEFEFEVRKRDFLESADAKILIYSHLLIGSGQDIRIVSEESSAGNDNKAFKKIPAISNILGIDCITLPSLLKKYGEIEVRF